MQSVAVRLVVDRENEIRAFVPQEYWSIDAKFTAPPSRKVFAAKLVKVDGKRVDKTEIRTKPPQMLCWNGCKMPAILCRT